MSANTSNTENAETHNDNAPPPAGGGENREANDTRTFSRAELDAEIKRSIEAEREQIKQQAREAQMSEQEKLKTRADRAEAALQQARAKDALTEAAAQAKARTPAKIFRLFKDEIKFDDKGEPTNVADLIAQAKKDFPEEFTPARGSVDGGAGSHIQMPNTGGMNDFIRRATGRR